MNTQPRSQHPGGFSCQHCGVWNESSAASGQVFVECMRCGYLNDLTLPRWRIRLRKAVSAIWQIGLSVSAWAILLGIWVFFLRGWPIKSSKPNSHGGILVAGARTTGVNQASADGNHGLALKNDFLLTAWWRREVGTGLTGAPEEPGRHTPGRIGVTDPGGVVWAVNIRFDPDAIDLFRNGGSLLNSLPVGQRSGDDMVISPFAKDKPAVKIKLSPPPKDRMICPYSGKAFRVPDSSEAADERQMPGSAAKGFSPPAASPTDGAIPKGNNQKKVEDR